MDELLKLLLSNKYILYGAIIGTVLGIIIIIGQFAEQKEKKEKEKQAIERQEEELRLLRELVKKKNNGAD